MSPAESVQEGEVAGEIEVIVTVVALGEKVLYSSKNNAAATPEYSGTTPSPTRSTIMLLL